jgi:predicted component of type VI protein secretion system
MSPMELNKFLEANIEDPGTIETLMQEYFPELYRQQIEVVGNRPPAESFIEVPDRTPGSPTDTTPQPPVLDDDRTVASTPAPAPGPSPAPSPTPSPAPKAQSGMDLSALFALLGMMNQDEDKPDPYQVAQINVPSPFGTVFDQQQNLLSMIGRG